VKTHCAFHHQDCGRHRTVFFHVVDDVSALRWAFPLDFPTNKYTARVHCSEHRGLTVRSNQTKNSV